MKIFWSMASIISIVALTKTSEQSSYFIYFILAGVALFSFENWIKEVIKEKINS